MKSNDLYDIIKSMSKSEKRYLKLHVDIQKGEKEYLKLFDAYDKLKNGISDPDQMVLKKLKGSIEEHKLPSLKNYLYNLILKNLNLANRQKSVDSELNELLEHMMILYQRRLYNQVEKLIRKTQKLALQHERHLALARCLKIETLVKKETLSPPEFQKYMPEATELFKNYILEHENSTIYEHAYYSILGLNRQIKTARSDHETELFNTFLENDLFTHENQATNTNSKFYFLLTKLTHAFGSGKYEQCIKIASDQMSLMELNPHLISEKPEMYFSAVTNSLVCMIHLSDYQNYFSFLEKLKLLSTHSFDLEVRCFVSTSTYEMVYYLDTGQFEKGQNMAKEMIIKIEEYDSKITAHEKIMMLYNIAYVYFGSGEYKKSLKFINLLLNEYKDDLRNDIHCAARIFALILFYETGKSVLIEHAVKSAKRYLKRSEKAFKLEQVLLNFLKSNLYLSKREIKDEFKKLRIECEKLIADPYEKPAFDNFHYFSWIDSKLNNLSFSENVQKDFTGVLAELE